MKNYIAVLNAFVKQNKQTIRCSKVDSLLDQLFCCFCQQKGADIPTVRNYYIQIDKALECLPSDQADQVIDLVCGLCHEQQKQAFREGALAGFCLYTELHQQDAAR